MDTNAHDIIIRPVLTEKSYAGIESKIYTFVVAKKANKTQIKNAIEKIYENLSIKVESVNTINVRGKIKRQGKTSGRTPSYKKAIIKLTADSKTITEFDSLN
ncbi:MAG: 50S ribosomal protein L23 [Clostridiales bacterium]|jgi:large subunit ribosomal protein L23|nr:50S ribosomal protein L23 [Clostridiales bacterium]